MLHPENEPGFWSSILHQYDFQCGADNLLVGSERNSDKYKLWWFVIWVKQTKMLWVKNFYHLHIPASVMKHLLDTVSLDPERQSI